MLRESSFNTGTVQNIGEPLREPGTTNYRWEDNVLGVNWLAAMNKEVISTVSTIEKILQDSNQVIWWFLFAKVIIQSECFGK